MREEGEGRRTAVIRGEEGRRGDKGRDGRKENRTKGGTRRVGVGREREGEEEIK